MRTPFGSRSGKPLGGWVNSGGSAIWKVSPAAALSGTHHWMSVRNGSLSRGLVGVTVMLVTGLGMVAASANFHPTNVETDPAVTNASAMNLRPDFATGFVRVTVTTRTPELYGKPSTTTVRCTGHPDLDVPSGGLSRARCNPRAVSYPCATKRKRRSSP